MMTLPLYEAKTRLSELLTAVEQGEQVIITRHGRAVAKLLGMDGIEGLTLAEIAARKRAMRRVVEASKGRSLGDMDIKATIEEGRD